MTGAHALPRFSTFDFQAVGVAMPPCGVTVSGTVNVYEVSANAVQSDSCLHGGAQYLSVPAPIAGLRQRLPLGQSPSALHGPPTRGPVVVPPSSPLLAPPAPPALLEQATSGTINTVIAMLPRTYPFSMCSAPSFTGIRVSRESVSDSLARGTVRLDTGRQRIAGRCDAGVRRGACARTRARAARARGDARTVQLKLVGIAAMNGPHEGAVRRSCDARLPLPTADTKEHLLAKVQTLAQLPPPPH